MATSGVFGSLSLRALLALLCFSLFTFAGVFPQRRPTAENARQTARQNGENPQQPSRDPASGIPSVPSSQTEQPSRDGVWHVLSEIASPVGIERITGIPQKYRRARLSQDALQRLISQAPMEFTIAAATGETIMTLPTPDGGFDRFRIEESPIMEEGLSNQFPEIKTYKGQGVDDATATMRFDWNSLGLHAIVLSAAGTWFVEPVSEGDLENYISYFTHDLTTENLSLSCGLSESDVAEAERRGAFSTQSVESQALITGPSLRTYRLAVAATGEFTQQYGAGSVATTLTKITTLINLVNALYQKEATITFQLVANETSIIFTDGASDPYTNDNPSAMLPQNQTTLDSLIQPANYDIGHVLGGISVSPGFVSFSGVASLGVVCGTSKGRGVSTMGGASSSFPHSIFVSGTVHEIGHQFSARHTFNSTTSGCSGNRDASGAYEPGSGSTIMGYSICGSDNIQTLPDLYFHSASLEQIVGYAGSSGSCASTSSTGNGAPAVGALSNFPIPANTPFTLTGSATDPNGDALTYNWEEFDLGSASPPNTDDGTRPLFRSFPPSTSPSRTFPKLQYILNNANVPPTNYACGGSTCLTGELLPSTTRTMNFRFTVRDNRASGGGTANAGMQLSVVSTAGPFAVTQPNTAVSWAGGTSQTVSWNVANTSGSPINCANVKISLSTDGGTSFPTVLAANTPNDGSESLVMPNISTTAARIKVESVGNVFFDISDTNFSITSGASTVQVTVQTNPAGRSFTVDSTTYTSAQMLTWTSGSSHTISTTSPQSGASGTRYVWSNWSDSGAISHTVAPTSGATYTANFATQFFLTMNAGSGGIVAPASNWFNSGQVVNITATPNSGFGFSGWTGTGSGSFTGFTNPSSVAMNGPITETASFSAITVKPRSDLDFDGRTDIGFYRDGLWGFLKSSMSYSFASSQFISWGASGLPPIVADFDGDGKVDLAYVAPPSGGQSAVYSILRSSTGYGFGAGQPLFIPAGFPSLGDTPVIGDFDGDGKADPGIWRASQGVWIIPLSSSGYTSFIFTQWGQSGDIPVVGDFDGDGKADVGFYRDGLWGVLKSLQNFSFSSAQFFSWGAAGLAPVVADFDGDGKADIGYVAPPSGGQSAAYSILRSSTGYGFGAGQPLFVPAGFPSLGDTPVVGDYDGDGKADPGIWRASQGAWIIPLSSGNYSTFLITQWGQSGDTALPNRLNQY